MRSVTGAGNMALMSDDETRKFPEMTFTRGADTISYGRRDGGGWTARRRSRVFVVDTVDGVQSGTLIQVRADGDRPVEVCFDDQGKNWSEVSASPGGDGDRAAEWLVGLFEANERGDDGNVVPYAGPAG